MIHGSTNTSCTTPNTKQCKMKEIGCHKPIHTFKINFRVNGINPKALSLRPNNSSFDRLFDKKGVIPI